MKEEYVRVPPRDARMIDRLKAMSKKGHSADVKYIERDKQWVFYEHDMKKQTIE